MKNAKKAKWAKENSGKVVLISMDDAARLPGMLAKIVPVALMFDGWYARTHDGKITYYELSA